MKYLLATLLMLSSVNLYAEDSLTLYKIHYTQDNVSENEWVILAYNMGEALQCYKKAYPRNSITKVSKMDDAINGDFKSADGLKYYEIKYTFFDEESVGDGHIKKIHVIAKKAEEALEFYKKGTVWKGGFTSDEPISIEVLVDYIHECQRPAKFKTKGK